MRFLLVTVALIAFSACATGARKINRISLGMTKAQVIDTIGQPDLMRAGDGVEVMEYEDSGLTTLIPGTYWVILQGGQVVKYGRAGDFGTALPSTQKVIIENR